MSVAQPVTDPAELPRGPKSLVTAASRAGWRWKATMNPASVVVRLERDGSRGAAYWTDGETKLRLCGCWAWTDGNPVRVSMTDLKGMVNNSD